MKPFRICSLTALIACFLLAFVAAAWSQSPTPSKASAPRKALTSPDNTPTQISEGERLFHENCGRCHNPPEDLSPREARAVVRQMRVRANLTAKDERALLKFLAP